MNARRAVGYCLLLSLCFSTVAFALERQPNAAYRARREALAAKAERGMVVVFAGVETEGPNDLYGFHQDDNFYYLTGLTDPGAAVLVASALPASENFKGRPYTEILFFPAHNYVQEKWTGPKLGPDTPDVKQTTGFDRVENLDRLREEIIALSPPTGGRVYANSNESTASALDWLKRANAFGLGGPADTTPLLTQLRVIKDDGEVALIRKATEASVQAHLAALRAIKPGITEHDISALMQWEFEKRGCERPAYAPIVGAGYNSTVLHYSADDGPIRDGDLVVMDVAGEYSMYASDITRTAPANGHFTARQREIYDIVLAAHDAAVKAFQSGKYVLRGNNGDHPSLYKIAYDYINSHGKDLHGKPLGPYFIHGLSHFVGLSVHDPGPPDQVVGPGMVFTIEPGIYIPEEKIGVRIEDTYVVGADGKLIRLSEGLPRTADEVEKAMAAH